jgi:AraC family ethanolamine operon transcriptional activator
MASGAHVEPARLDRPLRHSPVSIRIVQARKNSADAPPASGPFPAGLRIDVCCHDPDEMSTRALYWGLHQCQLGRGRFLGRMRAIHSSRLQLSWAARSPGLLIEGQVPRETVVLSSIARETDPLLLNGRRVAPHQVMRAVDARPFELRTLGANELVTIAVHAPLFHALERATLGRDSRDAGGSDRLDLDDAEQRRGLNQRLRALLDEGDARPERLTESGFAAAWERRVLDAYFAHAATLAEAAPPATRHRVARRAEEFLRAHLDRPVSICELCVESGAPRRTLMLGFREAFGIAPGAYHRRLRLNAARRELLHATTGEVTITAVALRWGFEHFGRFSVDYRQMFGESPRATLRD